MTSESGDRKGTLTGFVPAEWVRADIKHTSSWWIIMHPTKPMHMLQRIKWISAPLSNAARTPFIASLLVKRKSVISSCFRLSDLYMFSMSASSWHWRGLSGRHLNCRLKQEQEKVLKLLCHLELPVDSFKGSCSANLGLGANSKIIAPNKHNRRSLCNIHPLLLSPRYYRDMLGWGKMSWNNDCCIWKE